MTKLVDIDRKCFRCGSIHTFVSDKTGVAAWRRRKIIINGQKIWDGKNYYCDSCHHKLMKKCRNKNIDKNCNFGKGFRVEQAIAKALEIKNCNIELDNFNSVFDLYDTIKYKEIQSRSVEPSIRKASWNGKEYKYDVWHIGLNIESYYDFLFAVCMSKNYTNIERLYVIPANDVPFARGMTIYKDPKFGDKYKTYKDDVLLDKVRNAYHNLRIEDCPIIKNDIDKIKEPETDNCIKNEKIS